VEFQGWTLRVRPAKTKPARLLLLIHGWTGDENSMWVFARAVPQDYMVLAPRAPHATRPSGYSWRVPPPHPSDEPNLADLRWSAEALIGMIDDYRGTEGNSGGAFDIVGFSQGAALASVIALLHPERVTKVALLSGFVPRVPESLAPAGPLDGVRFFVAHGSVDEMVSIEHARQSVHLLEAAGATVTVCEDEVGHKVSAGCLRGLQAFLLG
jgi:phospholipase/carboxylesterase